MQNFNLSKNISIEKISSNPEIFVSSGRSFSFYLMFVVALSSVFQETINPTLATPAGDSETENTTDKEELSQESRLHC